MYTPTYGVLIVKLLVDTHWISDNMLYLGLNYAVIVFLNMTKYYSFYEWR
jgi:hypothetical protein